MTLVLRSADLSPATWNAEARTVDATFTTGAPVTRRDTRGPYIETLDLDAIDPAALAGLPVLDGHRQDGARNVVGVIVSARREGGAIVGGIRLSAAEDVRSTVQKVGEGVLRGVSVGYAPERWRDGTDASGRRTRTVTVWTIREISLVGVPADPLSQVRSFPLEPTAETTAPDTAALETRAAIRAIGRAAGLDSAWSDAQIDADADVTVARAAAFEAMTARRPAAIRAHVGASAEDPAVILGRKTEGLSARMAGLEPSDAARPFAAWGFGEFARDALARSGESGLHMMSREAILTRAMNGTSDFPQLLLGAGNRVLAESYKGAASPLMQLARKRTVNDFRAIDVLRLGGMGALAEVSEHGEITATGTVESGESYAIKTFGRTFALTRKAIINDDLGAFGRVTAELGKAAAETETSALVALLVANPVLSDGVALFHASHGNLADTAAAIGESSISAARLAMRSQTGLTGERIGVTPRFLVVGPSLETEAEKFLATINPTETASVNPFAGKLTLLVEPRLDGAGWYVFAAPSELAAFELAHLASAPGPQITMREGWETLGREFRIVLDFGVAAVENRGAFRNAGA